MGKFLGVGNNPWPGKCLGVCITLFPLHVSKGKTGGGRSAARKESFGSFELFELFSLFSSKDESSCCGRRDLGSSGRGSSASFEASEYECLDVDRDSRPEVLLMVRLFSDAVINSRKLALSLAEMSSRSDDVKLNPQLSILQLGWLRDSLVIGLSIAKLAWCSIDLDLDNNSDMGDGDGSFVLAGVKGLELGSRVDWKGPAV